MSDFQQTITSLDLLHTSLYRMGLFINAHAVKNAKTDVISLISRLEKAECENLELRERLSLVREQRDTELNKNTQLEAELARRDAAACEAIADMWIVRNADGTWAECGTGYHRGRAVYFKPRVITAPPAVLPPEVTEPVGEWCLDDLEGAAWMAGANWMRQQCLELGAQQQKVVELPEPVKWPEVPYRYFSEDQVFSMLNAANVKWEVKK